MAELVLSIDIRWCSFERSMLKVSVDAPESFVRGFSAETCAIALNRSNNRVSTKDMAELGFVPLTFGGARSSASIVWMPLRRSCGGLISTGTDFLRWDLRHRAELLTNRVVHCPLLLSGWTGLLGIQIH